MRPSAVASRGRLSPSGRRNGPTGASESLYNLAVAEFLDVTLSRVPAPIRLPEPLRLLFAWVEEQGFVDRLPSGELYGALGADFSVGTQIELRGYTAAEASGYLDAWFGSVNDDTKGWLWPFAETRSEERRVGKEWRVGGEGGH